MRTVHNVESTRIDIRHALKISQHQNAPHRTGTPRFTAYAVVLRKSPSGLLVIGLPPVAHPSQRNDPMRIADVASIQQQNTRMLNPEVFRVPRSQHDVHECLFGARRRHLGIVPMAQKSKAQCFRKQLLMLQLQICVDQDLASTTHASRTSCGSGFPWNAATTASCGGFG